MVADNWTCSMNMDPEADSCSKGEGDEVGICTLWRWDGDEVKLNKLSQIIYVDVLLDGER